MQYVQRAGSSNRTADELGEVFCLDVIDLVRDAIQGFGRDEVMKKAANELETALASLVWADGYSHWLEADGEHINQPEVLQDMVREAEGLLADIGLSVEWDDGYVICDAGDWDEDGNLIGAP